MRTRIARVEVVSPNALKIGYGKIRREGFAETTRYDPSGRQVHALDWKTSVVAAMQGNRLVGMISLLKMSST
jgi:hypothetical protein